MIPKSQWLDQVKNRPEIGKHRQQVIAQHRLIRLPAALASLGVGQIALGHEIPKGRHILEPTIPKFTGSDSGIYEGSP